MTQINSYLTFNGNCREAMNFYKDCLGGELNLQTIAESPLADKMPAQMKECILHANSCSGYTDAAGVLGSSLCLSRAGRSPPTAAEWIILGT
jgi:PhnB protein